MEMADNGAFSDHSASDGEHGAIPSGCYAFIMRSLVCVSLLVFLGAVACSGVGDAPRPGQAQGGTAAGGASGASILPGSGTSSSAGSGSTGMTQGGTTTGGSTGQAGSPANGGSAPDNKTANVITWVPPYRVDESKQQLAATFDGITMADGLSFLALQFWLTDGASAQLYQVSEAEVTWFHDWARQHGVKVLLCVHNNPGDWNWPEAVRAFKDNRDAFAANLVSQVMSRDLDGVDLDLEGIIEPTQDDQASYRLFVETLSKALRPLGKTLTLDSFHGQWNAPNWNWWPDLFPFVDGITSMGYEQSGMGVDYQELVDHATTAPRKLMIGVPSYQGTWLNHSVGEQLGWIGQQSQAGTAIWDASLMAAEWRQRAVWDQLKAIKSR